MYNLPSEITNLIRLYNKCNICNKYGNRKIILSRYDLMFAKKMDININCYYCDSCYQHLVYKLNNEIFNCLDDIKDPREIDRFV